MFVKPRPRASSHVPIFYGADQRQTTPPVSTALATPPPLCTREVTHRQQKIPSPAQDETKPSNRLPPMQLHPRDAVTTVSRERMFSRAPESQVSQNIPSGPHDTYWQSIRQGPVLPFCRHRPPYLPPSLVPFSLTGHLGPPRTRAPTPQRLWFR